MPEIKREQLVKDPVSVKLDSGSTAEIRPYDKELDTKYDNISVHLYQKPTDPSVTLAQITSSQARGDSNVWNPGIANKEEMTWEQALSRALGAADHLGINLILWKDDALQP